MARTQNKPATPVVEENPVIVDVAVAPVDEAGTVEPVVEPAGLSPAGASDVAAPEVDPEVELAPEAPVEAVVDLTGVNVKGDGAVVKLVQDEDQSIDLTPSHESISGEELTFEAMQAVTDGEIIAEGTKVWRSARHHYVAVKRTPGWSIVASEELHTAEQVMEVGQLVTGEGDIKFLVPCTDEAFAAYNYAY